MWSVLAAEGTMEEALPEEETDEPDAQDQEPDELTHDELRPAAGPSNGVPHTQAEQSAQQPPSASPTHEPQNGALPLHTSVRS